MGEAEVLARKAVIGLEEAFPAETRDVRPAGARARLAHVLLLRAKHPEADSLLRSAMRGYEASLGREHPQTLGCARNLAVLLKQSPQGRTSAFTEAEALFTYAADGYSMALGEAHPDAVRAAKNLMNFRTWRKLHRRGEEAEEKQEEEFW